MPSTFSTNLRIELIASGEQANQWGNTTNKNLGTLIEQAICGLTTVDVTAADVTLTALDGTSDQSRQMILSVTGTPGAPRQIIAPAVSKVYVVINGSDDDIEIVTDAVGSVGPTLASGTNAFVYSDGTDFALASPTAIYDPNIVVVTDAGGELTSSTTTTTELSYLNNVTSDIQTQLDAGITNTEQKFAINFILGM